MGITLDTLLEIISLTVVGVWAVVSVRVTTTSLGQKIEHLTLAVQNLNKTVSVVDQRTHNHEVRIAVLEDARPRPINL